MAGLDVLCVGHMLYDIRCYVGSFPKPDKASIIEQPIHTSSGGSAANVAINLAKLGRQIGIACSLGLDSHGKLLFEDLNKCGVEVGGVKFFKGKSGMSIVLVDRNAEVEVIESVGVCDNYIEISEDYIRSFRHLHATGTNFQVTKEAIGMASRLGLSVSFDPGRSKSALGEKKLAPLLSNIDQLLVNRKELALICASQGPLTANRRPADISEKTCELNAKRLALKYGIDVCVKGGKHQIIVAGGNGSNKGKFFKFNPFHANVVDTIGAGDAFAAGFIDAYLEGRSLQQCAKFAAACAAAEITVPGAHTGIDRGLIMKKFGPC